MEKVDQWVKDVKQLVEIAQEEPQAVLSAFSTGLSQRVRRANMLLCDIMLYGKQKPN